MKAVVFAYHEMGITGLKALLRAGFTIAAVFSHEDDPDERCWFGSVKEWTHAQGIPLFCPDNVNDPAWVGKIFLLAPDVIFSFYYRNLLLREIVVLPPVGAFNLHGSLLPAYRGRCPVNWVLVNGEQETGVTLHRMVDKADGGAIVAQRTVPIAVTDTARTLYDKLCGQAALLLDEALPLIERGEHRETPQDEKRGSYFGRRTPEDGRIDWRWPALTIYNLIRAVTEPYPGTFTTLGDGENMIIWWALPHEGAAPLAPGSIIQERGEVFIAAGDGGRLRLLDIEIQGKRLRNQEIEDYFRGKGRNIYYEGTDTGSERIHRPPSDQPDT